MIVVNVRNVPPLIKAHVRAEAESEGVSMSEIVVSKLAEFFQVEAERPRARPMAGSPSAAGDQLTLRNVPSELAVRLRDFSRAHKTTQSGAALLVLAQHYGVAYEPARRGGRRERQ